MSSKRPKKQSTSARKTAKSQNHFLSVNSNKTELSISKVHIKTNIKKQKINLYTNPKSLLPIYAYQSHKLKKCLLQNPKQMRQFFHANKCQNNGWKQELYAKPFLKYFRQWRNDLRARLTNIVIVITEKQKTIDNQQTQNLLHEIQYIVQELKQANQQIITHSSQQDKSVKQTKNLQQNFEHTEQYIKHLINLIRFLSEFEKEIQKMLKDIVTNNNETNHETQNSEISKKIKNLHAKYHKLIFSSFTFCNSHPESSFMNKAEYKIKKKFDSILTAALQTSKRAIELKIELNILKAKLQNMTIDPNSIPSLQKLEQIYTLIQPYKYFNKSANNVANQSNITSNLTASTVNTHQTPNGLELHPLIAQLQTEIAELVTQFLNKLELQSTSIIQNQFNKIKQYRVENCFTQKQSFKNSKKVLLILANIFNRNPFLGYFSIISTFIKENSHHYQDINEIIKNIYDKAQSKKAQSNQKYIPKIIQNILELVLKFEQKQSIICNAIKLKFSIQSQPKILQPKQSEQLQNFLTVWNLSISNPAHLQQSLSIPKHSQQTAQQTIPLQKVEQLIQSNNRHIHKIIKQVLPNFTANSQQFMISISNNLINKFISFQNHPQILDSTIHQCLPIIQSFYTQINSHNHKQMTSQSLANMLQCLQKSIQKCKSLSTAQEPIQFMSWIFSNGVCSYHLANMGKVNAILCYPDNTKFIPKSSKVLKNKLAYQWNPELQQYLQSQKQLLNTIILNTAKYPTQNSLINGYFNDSYKSIANFIAIQTLYTNYDRFSNNEYKICTTNLQNWLTSQFHYLITKSITQQQIKSTRKQMKLSIQSCIQNCHQITQQHHLPISFIQHIQQNVEQLTVLLSFALPKIIQNNVPQCYEHITQAILKYIKFHKYFHIAFYSNNHKPLTFISQNYSNHFQSILNHLVNKIVPQAQKQNNQRIQQIRLLLSSCVDFQQQSSTVNFKQQKAPFILQNQPLNRAINPQIETQAHFILDEIPSQQINQSIGSQKQSEMQQNRPLFILANQNKTYNNEQSIKFKQYYPIPSFYQPKSCFKFTSISSINFIMSLLQQPAKVKKLALDNNIGGIFFAPDTTKQNNQKQFMKVKKFIKLQKLMSLLEEQMPQEEDKQKMMDHLQEGLGMISGFRVVEKNGDNLGLWKLFNCLSNLKQALNLCNHEQKKANFAQLLEIFSYQLDCIFCDAPKQNKIYLLTLPSSSAHSQQSYFAYLSLYNLKPFHSQPDLLPDEDFTKFETQYFEYLLKDKEEQQWKELKIKQGIQELNKTVLKGYKQVQQQIGVWRKYGVDNSQECEVKMKEYLSQVVGSRTFTDGEVGYKGYCKMVEEYREIIVASNEYSQFHIIHIDQQLPIFISRNSHELQKFLSQNFTIFTNPLNNYSKTKQLYITSTNGNTSSPTPQIYVNIHMQQLMQNIVEQISKLDHLKIQQICPYIYGTADSNPQIEIMNKKQQLLNIYPPHILQQYNILSKIYKTIGKISSLQQKVRNISLQFEILEKFSKLHAKQSCFILPDICQQKQKQASLLSKTSFMLSNSRIVTQFKSYEMEQLFQLYQAAEIPCQIIKFNTQIIGIVDQGMEIWQALSRLGVQDYGKLECQKLANNQKSPKTIDTIQIKNLFIQVKVGQIIQKFSQQQKSLVQTILSKFYLQIYDKNQTIDNLDGQSYTKIECSYPHRSIPIKLFQKSFKETIQHCSFIIKHYAYGSQYIFRTVQEYLIKYIKKELHKQSECHQNNKAKFMSESLGGKAHGSDIEKLMSSKVKGKFQKLKGSSETDDQSLQISIVLSEKAEVFRDQLIQMKLNSQKFKMADVLQEIQTRKKLKY